MKAVLRDPTTGHFTRGPLLRCEGCKEEFPFPSFRPRLIKCAPGHEGQCPQGFHIALRCPNTRTEPLANIGRIRVCALNFYLDGIVHVPADNQKARADQWQEVAGEYLANLNAAEKELASTDAASWLPWRLRRAIKAARKHAARPYTRMRQTSPFGTKPEA